jgi:tryptophan synthase alpha chain
MSDRIDACFARLRSQGRKALIPFVTAGDPDPAVTVDIMHALVSGGADILELGVPFSDPMADGPVIQRASERALAKGVRLRDVLQFVRAFRTRDEVTPVVLMGYLNPIERMGAEVFAEAARAAGVDGVLIVDLPPEEANDVVAALSKHGLAPIFLLAPTSNAARVKMAVKHARGYLYYVSLKGVTGAKNIDTAEVAQMLAAIKRETTLPIGVGFGIRDGATAAQVAKAADAVVVGSRLVEAIESSPQGQAAANIQALIASFRLAMDTQPSSST